MRGYVFAGIAGVLVLGLAGLAAPTLAEADLTVTLAADGSVEREDPGGLVVNESHDLGSRYAWTLNRTAERHVVEVHAEDGLGLERPRQLVPLLNGSHFVETDGANVTGDRAPSLAYNLTRGEAGFTYRLGLPGPGPANLTLEVDRQPPKVDVGEYRKLTQIGFTLNTSTDEPALARLTVTPVEGGEGVPFPIHQPDVRHRFPVQGLDANTTYRVELRYEDWSGNVARVQAPDVRTPPEPEVPEPVVTAMRPVPNGTVTGGLVVVEATVESSSSTVPRGNVRVFFDKQEVEHGDLEFEGSTVRLVREDVREGPHSVSVEAENAAGGLGVARWSFEVEPSAGQQASLGIPAVLSSLVASALAFAARRR